MSYRHAKFSEVLPVAVVRMGVVADLREVRVDAARLPGAQRVTSAVTL